jgi:hypothetical protein
MPEGYSNINYESFSNVKNSNVENSNVVNSNVVNSNVDTLAILVLQNTDDGYIQSQYDKYSETLEKYKEDDTINNTDYNTLQRKLSNVESSKNTLLNSLLASAKLVELQRVKDSLGLDTRNLMTRYLNMQLTHDNMKCETNDNKCRVSKTALETKLNEETLPELVKKEPKVQKAVKEYKDYAKDNQETIKGYVAATVQHNQNETLFIAAFAKAIGNMNNEIRKQVEDACMIEAQRRYDSEHKVTVNYDDFTCTLSGKKYKTVGNTNKADATITTTTTTTTTNTYDDNDDDDMAPPTPSGETTTTGRVIGGLFAGIIILGIFFLAINCFFGGNWVSCAWLAILGSGSDSKPSSSSTTTTTTTTIRGSAPAPTRVLGKLETSKFNPEDLDKISSTGLTTSEFN